MAAQRGAKVIASSMSQVRQNIQGEAFGPGPQNFKQRPPSPLLRPGTINTEQRGMESHSSGRRTPSLNYGKPIEKRGPQQIPNVSPPRRARVSYT